jgi:hypothetical protein
MRAALKPELTVECCNCFGRRSLSRRPLRLRRWKKIVAVVLMNSAVTDAVVLMNSAAANTADIYINNSLCFMDYMNRALGG